MSKRAEEKAREKYPYETGMKGLICENSRGIYIQGYEQAEKDLGWRSVEGPLPEMDEEVIVLKDKQNTGLVYEISFGHLVDTERCIDYDGWNVQGVKFWMPMPKIPED